jgi:hypothetical protein
MTEHSTVADVRARIAEIEKILFHPSANSPSHILRRPDNAALVAREQQMDALRRERANLLASLPPTGEASGMHLVLARTLGTVYVRASEPVYQVSQRDLDRDDPFLRHMWEMGEDWR